MNYGRYFIPNLTTRSMMPFSPVNMMVPRNTGLFNKVFNSLKDFNWRGLLNGASKTLNVVNQTIPLIKQATPMVNNVKSIVKLAKAFGNETNNSKTINSYIRNDTKIIKEAKDTIDNEYPTFFV